MKKRLCIWILVISLVFPIIFAIADDTQHVFLDVSCDSNFIFTRYDVDIYLDKEKVATLKHGQKATYTVIATPGSHIFWFYKADDHNISGSFRFDFVCDTDISCRIHCHGDRVEVNESVDVRPTPEPTPAPLYRLLLDKTELVLKKGESSAIIASIENYTADGNLEYQWTSANPEIASCSGGLIKAESSGKTTISCIAALPEGIQLQECFC